MMTPELQFVGACGAIVGYSMRVSELFVGDPDPKLFDDELTFVLTLEICQRPFGRAFDLEDEYVITTDGVCYLLDFTPTDEQIEAGMVPCPEDLVPSRVISELGESDLDVAPSSRPCSADDGYEALFDCINRKMTE